MHHRRLLAAGAASLLLLVVAGCGGDDGESDGGAGSGASDQQDQARATTSTSQVELGGGTVTVYEGLSQDHVTGEVDYPETPPVGGEHAEVWQDCGSYDEPVPDEAAVHSLEHGAVWITYRPDLPDDQVERIDTYAEQPYVLASPWEDDSLPAPIVLTAWGAQLRLDALPAPEADEFMATYRSAPTAPEPGAPCTGGLS